MTYSEIREWQIRVNGAGYSPALKVDGINGPKTQAGISWFKSKWSAVQEPMTEFDERTERLIITLHKKVQPIARQFLQRVRAAGIDARIISGHRTFAEQQALYDQAKDRKDNDGDGRTDERDETVTKAPAGYSNHNFALAWDLGIFLNGKYQEESPQYDVAGRIGKAMGLEWGGDWVSMPDKPHFQVRTGLTMAQLRERARKGQDVLA